MHDYLWKVYVFSVVLSRTFRLLRIILGSRPFLLHTGNENCITAKATPGYCRDNQLLTTFGRTLIYLYLSLGARLQAWHTISCLNQLEVVNQY